MTPTPDSSIAPADALRRQLILAQVQLMELEDARDDLQTRLDSARDLLAQTQRLGDQALQDRSRLEDELRNLQAADAALQAGENALRAELSVTRERETALAARLATLETQLAAQRRTLADSDALSASRQTRIDQLEAERRELKASRSWRYTTPLRWLERALRRGGPPA
jgi:chromosome segregation ATPase